MQTKNILSIAAFAFAAITLGSCGNQAEQAQKELDSLRNVVAEQQNQLQADEEFTDAINFSMDSVVAAEGIIMKNSEGGVPNRQRLKQNVEAYKTILQKYRDRINKLQASLKNQKSAHAKKMQELIDKMQAQLDEKDAQIEDLKKQIEDKNVSIAELNTQVTNLGNNVRELTDQTVAQAKTITDQTDKMNEAYFIIDTSKNLKAKGLMVGGGLFSKKKLDLSAGDLSKLTKIDMRAKKTFSIPSAKPKILTQAPAGSYTLIKTGDKSSTLTITDVARFWSMSNVLVISY
jgi:archaellum component FlaC